MLIDHMVDALDLITLHAGIERKDYYLCEYGVEQIDFFNKYIIINEDFKIDDYKWHKVKEIDYDFFDYSQYKFRNKYINQSEIDVFYIFMVFVELNVRYSLGGGRSLVENRKEILKKIKSLSHCYVIIKTEEVMLKLYEKIKSGDYWDSEATCILTELEEIIANNIENQEIVFADVTTKSINYKVHEYIECAINNRWQKLENSCAVDFSAYRAKMFYDLLRKRGECRDFIEILARLFKLLSIMQLILINYGMVETSEYNAVVNMIQSLRNTYSESEQAYRCFVIDDKQVVDFCEIEKRVNDYLPCSYKNNIGM